jgi:hypothetical protein
VDGLTKTKFPFPVSLTKEQIDFFKRQENPDSNELIGKLADSLMESESRGGEAKSFDFEAKLALLEARKRRIEEASEVVVTDEHGQELRGKIDFNDEWWWSRSDGQASGEWWHQNRQHFKTAENGVAPANQFALEPVDIDGEIFMKQRRERAEALKQVDEEIAKLKKNYVES